MKYFILLVFLLSGWGMFSQNGEELVIPWESKKRILHTFSSDLDQKKSFHVIFYKDKNRQANQYGVLTYYIDEVGKIYELKPFNLDKKPRLVSVHQNDSLHLNLVLAITKLSEERLLVLDYNLELNSESSVSDIGTFDYNNILGLPGKTLLFKAKDNIIEMTEVVDGQHVYQKKVVVDPIKTNYFEKIFHLPPEFISRDRYLGRASVHSVRGYHFNDTLFFERVDLKSKHTVIAALDIQNEAIDFNWIKHEFPEKLKKANGFLFENYLFNLLKYKKKTFLKVVDIKSLKVLLEMDIEKGLADYVDKESLLKLIKNMSGRYTVPTLAVNETVDKGNMLVVLDYVHQASGIQYYDHWFMHQRWMWQQQLMHDNLQNIINNIPTAPSIRFGPATEEVFNFYENEGDTAISFVLSPDFKLLPNADKTPLLRKVDKEKFEESITKNSKHACFAYTQQSLRYLMFLGKEFNSFTLKTYHFK